MVFDPKGDYLQRFWRPGGIVINDPRSEEDERPWNLLAELETSQLGSHDERGNGERDRAYSF